MHIITPASCVEMRKRIFVLNSYKVAQNKTFDAVMTVSISGAMRLQEHALQSIQTVHNTHMSHSYS